MELFARTLRRFPLFRAEPRSPRLARARSIAFIAGTKKAVSGQRWIHAAEARGAAVDVFSLMEPYRRADGQVMSFVFRPPQSNYDCVVLSEEIELFEHSWSYAFLDRLNTLAALDGEIILPRYSDPTSYLSDAKLNELFGRTPEPTSDSYLGYRRAEEGLNRPRNAAHSTLDAYWPPMERLIYGKHDAKLREIVATLGAENIRRRGANRETDILLLLQSQSYRSCSARTKAPITEHIASIYFPERKDLSLADLGAGTGLNSLELLLNPGPVASLTLVEPRRSYHWDIAAVYEQVRDYLKGPVSLVDKRVEEYSGTGVDVGLICAVLAMMPKERREAFLTSAWNNLTPAGF
jgi:hypothetical protein